MPGFLVLNAWISIIFLIAGLCLLIREKERDRDQREREPHDIAQVGLELTNLQSFPKIWNSCWITPYSALNCDILKIFCFTEKWKRPTGKFSYRSPSLVGKWNVNQKTLKNQGCVSCHARRKQTVCSLLSVKPLCLLRAVFIVSCLCITVFFL